MKNTKRTRRVAAFAAAVMMVACAAVPMGSMTASAVAGEYTINVSPTTGNVSAVSSAKAYRIFALTLDKYDVDAQTYGSYSYTVDDTCVLTKEQLLAYKPTPQAEAFTSVNELVTSIKTDADARAFGDWIYTTYKTQLEGASKGVYTADTNGVIDTETAGYYLVYGVGINSKGEEDKNTVVSQVMLDSTDKTAELILKLDAPSLDKEIKHNELNTWGKVGDNQIGDQVEFRISTTVPSLAGYTDQGEKYKYVIHDTLDAGLTYTEGSLKIYTNAGLTEALDTKYYEVVAEKAHDACTFEVSVDVSAAVADKAITENSTIYTYYTAELNSNALVATGESDSTNHNDNIAYLEYSNNPYATDDGNQDTGETPEVEVYDWTFYEDITKVAGKIGGTKLDGAEFSVYAVNPVGNTDAKPLEFINNGDGTYTLKSSKADVTGKTVTSTIVSKADAAIKLKGLDDAVTYYLQETKEPEGYTLLSTPVSFKITAGYLPDGADAAETPSTLQTLTDDNTTDGANNLDVINKAGSALPSTGGIGTTLFYVGGGVLVAGAGVLLITKKRAKKDAE